MSHDLRAKFLDAVRGSVADGSLQKLTLARPLGREADLRNLFVRPVTLRGGVHLSFVWRHATRDVTKNHPPAEALEQIASLVGDVFRSAHLFTSGRSVQFEIDPQGSPILRSGPANATTSHGAHDRIKERLLPDASQAWLQALGVTTASGSVAAGMADKHRQIQKFVEILAHRTRDAGLDSVSDRPLEVADMGCGKGYLTFAAHDYFSLVEKLPVRVRGFELRPNLVDASNRIARASNRNGLSFEAGAIEPNPRDPLDVLIALHACDTATDDALAHGIAARAALIVVAPCCQRELRPQLTAPPVLAPALRHGIFQERQAEFVTDSLRALLLEWAGYETRVFEFISTEHTAKNTMITATRRGDGSDSSAADSIRAFAAFYGIREQALARHLGFSLGSA
ncbi:MAG TPA: SAM-dependent methyltransferase [Candidatus Didemnitutus sp.]|jgi:hypothetical protein